MIFLKVKTFGGAFCSQNLFAKVIGRSSTFVFQLKCYGVVKTCAAGVLISQSLRAYFNSYLQPHLRRAEICAAVGRISNLAFIADNDFLKSARGLQKQIEVAKMKVILLKFLNRLDAEATTENQIEIATRELQSLIAKFAAAKEKLRRVIIAAKFPAAIENVLLRRYVDCEKWSEIAESVYSLSYSFAIHRQGRKFFDALAQESE